MSAAAPRPGGRARPSPASACPTSGPVYQPVFDLRDGRVVGYEALVRGGPDSDLESPAELFAAARTEDLVAEFDAACREAAVRGFQINGSGPFALFLNAAAETLGDAAEQIPASKQTVVIEITEQALVANPDTLLHALTRFRTQGWGVAIDDVGADSRSLALMPLLYPDVIKLDLRRLQERAPGGHRADRRRGRVRERAPPGARARRGHRLRGAARRRARVRRPARPGLPARRARPAPRRLPEPGRKLRLTASGGDLAGDPPFSRVTNWKRPAIGSRELAERTAGLIMRQALALGETAVVLAAFPDEQHVGPEQADELRELAGSLAFVGALAAPPELADAGVRTGQLAPDDPLRGTWTVDRARPRPRRLLRRPRGRGRDLRARHLLRPRPGRGVGAADHGPAAPARSASSLITFESWLPCQASGELPGSSEQQPRARDPLRVGLADRVRDGRGRRRRGWRPPRSAPRSAASSSHASNGRERGTAWSASATASGCSWAPRRWRSTLSIVAFHCSGTSGSP